MLDLQNILNARPSKYFVVVEHPKEDCNEQDFKWLYVEFWTYW